MTSISALDLAALLCSRVCHDVVGSVGAVSNGLEVLDEENDPDMRAIAENLVRTSAAKASASLTFARVAFGAAGSARAEIDLDEARAKATDLIAFEKADLDWQMPRAIRPKNEVKLLLNLLLVALSAVPRGGTITVDMPDDATLRLRCQGPNARVPKQAEHIGTVPQTLDGVDAHAIQPIYTALLAADINRTIVFALDGDLVTITA